MQEAEGPQLDPPHRWARGAGGMRRLPKSKYLVLLLKHPARLRLPENYSERAGWRPWWGLGREHALALVL